MSCSHNRSYPQLNYDPGAKWIKNLTRDRLNNFNGGRYADINLASSLFTHRLDGDDYVKLKVWSAPGLTKPGFEEAMGQQYRNAKKGESFGPSWTNHWFKVYITIPKGFDQYERVQLEFDPGCEAMVFDVGGTPLQGITGGYGGDRRVEYIIPKEAVVRGSHEVVIEVSCNGMFGVPFDGDIISPPDPNRYFSLAMADLVVPNQDAWRLLWDFFTLKELVNSLPGNSPLQNKALVAANEIMNVFGRGGLENILNARKVAESVFGEAWEAKGDGIYHEGDKHPEIWGIGHCHIDSAWLWPYSVTQQKVARSWSTQVDLMERYPEHRFTSSSAQQYKWLEQLYPKLFSRVKEKVLEGKFHPIGGSWVENDGNMPSGEALIRQFLYGQRYFQSRFGIKCDTAWLPDSFGLTGALPQLIRGSGMKYFFTQKLSWNNVNTFPHSTFNWVGIDGTQVLCHMTPVDTYTAQATVGEVNKGVSNHKNLESTSNALLVFGNGDGGGGPLAKMLENLRRIRATNNQHRELARVVMGRSVDEFFDMLVETTSDGQKLPNWHGELYLEFHRGTYTSHGSIKKGNRHSEILLRDVEYLATIASLAKLSNPKVKYEYPRAKLDESWEKVLLNQFHDVLPGSAIGMVYDDAEKLYAEVRKDGHQMLEDALSVLFPESVSLVDSFHYPWSPAKRPSLAPSGKIVAFNTTFLPRREVIAIPMSASPQALKSKVIQTSQDGATGYAIMECGTTGVAESMAFNAECMPVSVLQRGDDHFVLKNSSVELTLSGGRITSLFDVQLGRELLAKGKTGGLVVFDDRPNYWDAWDVEIHHLEAWKRLEFTSISVVAHGPLRAAVEAQLKYDKSNIRVIISLDAVSATVARESRSMFVFDAKVDWHQRHEFLKFELPLDIHNDNATYETQFGWVQRPTHKNTTWDQAKFEVCGHKYADLSEFGYGVAILSESKYGFSCLGNVLRISLLRAATAPDANQDQGEHKFSWAVLPHQGHFIQSDVPQAAFLFNSPLHVRFVKDGVISPHGLGPFSLVGDRNVFMETVKRGEADTLTDTSSATAVVRLYEAFGGHGRTRLRVHSPLPLRKAFVTNLLEEEDVELDIARIQDADGSCNELKLQFRGFEVKTVKLVFGEGHSGCAQGEEEPKRNSWVTV